MSIEVHDIHKQFGAFTALDGISLEFQPGQLTALLGPSGCGKTTLLRIIAGLESADRGEVVLNGENVSGTHVRQRQVGFVFQHYALFRHMSVFENVAFGLRVKPRRERPSEAHIRERVMELLQLVQLDWLADRRPSALSGGQRQRIALARALAVAPRVLLLDEPFGALDAKVRKELRRWLRRLHDELNMTSLFVTHDQEEALELADEVVIMNQGRIEQHGTPQAVYEHPATPFVLGFLGHINLFRGRIQDGHLHSGEIRIPLPGAHTPDASGTVYVRPHELQLKPRAGATSQASMDLSPPSGLPLRLQRAHAFGPLVRLELVREDTGEPVDAVLSSQEFEPLHAAGHRRFLGHPRHARVFLN